MSLASWRASAVTILLTAILATLLVVPPADAKETWSYRANTNRGANTMSFDGTTYSVGGQAVSGRFRTTDLNEFVRFVTTLYDEGDVQRFGTLTGGDIRPTLTQSDADDWTVRISGQNIGGATVVRFDNGWREERWARELLAFYAQVDEHLV